MALTNTEKQKAWKGRQKEAGRKEVRGMWLDDPEKIELRKKYNQIKAKRKS